MSGDARDCFARPIPAWLDAALPVRPADIAVDRSHARFAEPLVEARTAGLAGESYYARTDALNAPYYRRLDGALDGLWLRASVVERLHATNEQLRPLGLELFLLDGYRPIAVQHALWDYFRQRVASGAAGLDEAEIDRLTRDYCADPRRFDPDDSTTWPPHTTGGAVDLTLRRRASGEHLYMGGAFDDFSPVSHTRHFEEAGDIGVSATEARRHRRLLYWTMEAAGFTNYAHEWWHFDYGNQRWAASLGASSTAFYGPTAPPIDEAG